MLNGKIKIQKKYDGKTPGIIIFGKIKHKKLYTKINVIVKENKSTNYKYQFQKILKISISKKIMFIILIINY